MPFPKTETRIPFNFQATDLGEVAVSSDDNVAVIAYYATPIAIGRQQTYVVIITGTQLQNDTTAIQWQVNNLDTTTTEGVWEYTPNDEGPFTLNVTLRSSTNEVLNTVSFEQTVLPLNQDLENLIVQDNATHPVAGDPDTSTEIINDMLMHIHSIAPVSTDQVLNRLLFGTAYTEALDTPKNARERLIAELRRHVNNGQASSFIQNAATGGGICKIRPEILAMTIEHSGSPLIPWEDIPLDDAARQIALTRIQATLSALPENHQIDLFNLLRFPKANLHACKLIFDKLRSRLFSGNPYNTIMSNDTHAHQIIQQFKSGPYAISP